MEWFCSADKVLMWYCHSDSLKLISFTFTDEREHYVPLNVHPFCLNRNTQSHSGHLN